ncbi:MAG: histidinol dehydrogenase [Candidatus Abyssobacteria bacterium SURF_5]|uniref:Histidinol dehydrogenase n=1 Tax=Abyssobacteria bacterium (strain SURF_5) TaxID=2093360 RepID=A0A3A4NQF7_ABYX5|nr:MAG: histidinol dehydrogenase [Candidatus Abyssubacteria bacterium SURF_5]
MLTKLDTSNLSRSHLEKALFSRLAEEESARIEVVVKSVVRSVRRDGDKALVRLTKKFDGITLRPDQFRIEHREIEAAYGKIPPDTRRALKRAHANITAFHKKSLRASWGSRARDNSFLGQKITAIANVGVYCPGGKAYYPSSVLMNVVPAKVAGCSRIVMVSPPSSGGSIHPALLVAADIAGATDIYRVGGAQAVAALAFGTETIPKVDKIVGPGNIFVTYAKRLVTGEVAIDMEAGPSEIVIIADSSASARFVAADMLSQAEHDELASAILLTTSDALAQNVLRQLRMQMKAMERRHIISESLRRNGLVLVCRTIDEAVELANRRAPEHLELLVRNPQRLLEKIEHAGVVFLGEHTPNAVGDYFAGPNHVLPTGGRARFSSPLSAEDFLKVTNVVSYTSEKLRADARDIVLIAELEGLTAHANAIRVRTEK